ncbi:hypothetical protein BG005_001847 [Podila minutissima]|nr:hypothetical protein BG005_001847 [Podila minutissima]
MANTMKFGPEWMRRFPAKTAQPTNDLLPRAPSPLQDTWGQPVLSQHQSQLHSHHSQPQPQSQSQSSATAFSYSSVAANNVRSQNGPSSIESAHLDTPSDTLNPFKYSKELMLSLFKPVGFPIEFERHEYATSEEALLPMSSQPFSDQEIKILSGSVNSEVARRVVQPGEGQERTQGQRRESLSSNDKERDYAGRHDRSERSDRSSHSRNHDSKYQGSGIRTRHLNSEDRSHSFKRSEQQQQTPRDQDEGLWNSPVRNTVGTFDSNGVFRVSHEGEALGSLALEESPEEEESLSDTKGTLDELHDLKEPKESPTSIHSGQELAPSDHGSEKHDSSIINGLDDKFSFNPSAPEVSPPVAREEPEFASFSSANSGFNAPAFDSPVELSKWLYRDPSGSVQGPFQSEEMHEWYKGGFFSMDLLVKREQDPTFEPLGQLIRRVGSDDKPFLLAGIVRPEIQSAPIVRPNMTLPQSRQNLGQFTHSSWGGLSAPSTPGTPSFGVDRMFMQQQQQQQQQQHQQQQHSSGDLFGNQGSEYGSNQEPGFSGYEQKWNSAGLFGGPSQGMGSGWAGDAFSRAPMANIPGPQTPLGNDYLSQQRLLAQQLERQQYLQMLQRQSHMQQIIHQQQFMAAQQQFGNDPHALAALLSQQQAQQRQLQMRQQQIQHIGFHGPNVSTPGGSMAWGGLGQPSSPWSSSIIQSSSDNYFDVNNGEANNVPHSLQQQQQQQQHQSSQHEQSIEAQDQAPHVHPAPVEEHVDAVTEQIHNLAVEESERDDFKDAAEHTIEEEHVELHATKEVEEPKVEHIHHEEHVEEVKEHIESSEEEETKTVEEWETNEDTWEGKTDDAWVTSSNANDDTWGSTDNAASEDNWGTPAPEPRLIKSVPAPWAKAPEEDASERKGPSLREIQEMEAKKAEEVRAAERQAQQAAVASGVMDFTKGMSGASPWQTASAPKKKTLREILEEEEAALKKARASQAAASPPPSVGSSAGLAAIVTSGTGSAGKRYADTIGPKPASVIASGPWGSPSTSAASVTAKPASVGRATSSYASTSVSAPTRPAVDNSWIEVDNKRGKPSSAAPAPEPAVRPAVVHTTNNHKSSNSDEPRPASEDFLRWCRQALKGLQGVVLEDFIQMLLSFPLNPDPMTVEIIQDSIYANSQSLDGRRFADEFIRRRKADAFPNGPAQSSASSASLSSLSSSVHNHSGADSFKVVSKKGKKKGTA